MVNKTDTYGLFPLHLIYMLHIDAKQAAKTIIYATIANYGANINIDLDKALNSVIYDYYNNKQNPDLLKFFKGFVKAKQFNPDKCLRGFDGNSFNPVFERKELTELAQSYPDFENTCIDYYRYTEAISALKLSGNISNIIDAVNKANLKTTEFEEQFGRDASVMLKIDMLFQFMKEDKTVYECELLAAYAAIKSIIGKKDFCCTTKAFIVMRICGAKNEAVLSDLLTTQPKVKAIYERYSKRYHFDKLLLELQHKNFIAAKIGMVIGCKSRLFISCSLNYVTLPIAVANYLQSNKKKSTNAQLKTQERAAIDKIKALIQ